MQNFKYIFVISLLVFAGNSYAAAKNSVPKHQEDSCEDMWDKSSDTEKQEKPRKKTLIKRDLLVVGTIIVAYALAVYTKIIQSPMKIGENFYKNFTKKPELTEEEIKKLLAKQECIICCTDRQCVKYCDSCYKNNFICLNCINHTIDHAAWIYKNGKRIKNVICPCCRQDSLNACFDTKYLNT